MPDWYERIKQQYKSSQGDATGLFSEILLASGEIGRETALAYLEQCVIEKRSAWLEAHLPETLPGTDPVMQGYRWFYEKYLGVSLPQDGEIVEHTAKRLVMRWRNPCPTLEACKKLGLDTREVCRRAYHRPVDEFLKRIHPRLRFDRDYASIRPHAGYCEEIIVLEE